MPNIEIKSRLSPELAYRNITEWLYAKDGTFNNRTEWREEFLKVLRFNLLETHVTGNRAGNGTV